VPGFLGVFPSSGEVVERSSILETIDPSQSCQTVTESVDGGLLAVSGLTGNPLQTQRRHERHPYVAVLAGDLVGTPDPPWDTVLGSIASGRYHEFAALRGPFAFGFCDPRSRKIFLVSDRTSQQPLYYSITNSGFAFSTTLATFCRLPKPPPFNPKWLYEVLYFNYPIGQTTFLDGVWRMPAATILEFDRHSRQLAMNSYASRFASPAQLLDGADALDRAHAVFKERIPDYFQPKTPMALSLTAGFDARTVASYLPPECRSRVETYTYGVPRSEDAVQAAKLAKLLGSRHTEVRFDDSFRGELASLAYQTVYLSHGLERLNRSTLAYAYRTLKKTRPMVQAVVTGVSGDHLFRDHVNGLGNVPSIITASMMRTIRTGERRIEAFRGIVGRHYDDFERHIHETLDEVSVRCGDLGSPEGYLSYLVYEAAPKYFGAEAAIASNYVVLRTPYWDADIVQLAYDITLGTLGLSRDLPAKDHQKESVLQASLIRRQGTLDRIAIAHIPVRVWAKDDHLVHQLHRILRRGPRKLLSLVRHHPDRDAEDWKSWYATVLSGELNQLVSRDSLVASYVDPDFVSKVKDGNDRHWLGKLATVEIVLKLIGRRWNL
jgi:asparagine synthetase B (glutamine-hydrolysing)